MKPKAHPHPNGLRLVETPRDSQATADGQVNAVDPTPPGAADAQDGTATWVEPIGKAPRRASDDPTVQAGATQRLPSRLQGRVNGSADGGEGEAPTLHGDPDPFVPSRPTGPSARRQSDGTPGDGITESAAAGWLPDAVLAELPYQLVAHLGSGGMGEVWEAWDPSLHRSLAVKLLHGDSPQSAARFREEAQAQARVDHHRVCRVYEVGEAGGRPYIAMQLVTGPPLSRAARDMSREQKVRVIRQVAEAVHAAHRTGLVHRDLKPANILLEVGTDGELLPYVADFGLARRLDLPSATQTGALLGSPAYMSPEQAAGSRDLDRRTDVWSLGATLFELLAGQPPFAGDSVYAVLSKVLHDEPQRLRQLVPDVPADLDTIVATCLERDLSRRYDSARALADDLGHFLDGEPIAARPISRWEHWRRRLRKHRAAVAVSGAAIVCALGFGVLALHSQLTLQARARAAQRLGQEVERIESFWRLAKGLPLHDTTAERERAQQRLDELAKATAALGGFARGPSEYALGRGALALGDPSRARRHLEAAWNDGYREPEVSFTLGRALGELYQREKAVALRVPNPEVRQSRLDELDRELRQPALIALERAGDHHQLAAAGAAFESAAYPKALLAFYARRDQEALAALAVATRETPWLPDVPALAGDVELAQALDAREAGQVDHARQHFASADQHYALAITMARSDAELMVRRCSAWLEQAELASQLSLDLVGERQQVLATCGEALVADPRNADAHDRIARVEERRARWLLARGADVAPAVEASVAAARRAAALRPEWASPWNNIGTVWWVAGQAAQRRGDDPSSAFVAAVAGYEEASKREPSWDFPRGNLGNVYFSLGQQALGSGEDPTQYFARAVGAYQLAINLNPTATLTWSNLAGVQLLQAFYEMGVGRDPSAALDASLAAARTALTHNPNDGQTRQHLAVAGLLRGLAARERGERPDEFFAAGVVDAEAAVAAEPGDVPALINLGALLTELSTTLLERNDDPRSLLDRARTTLEKGLALDPTHADLHGNLAAVEGNLGRYLEQTGADGRDAFDRALAHAARATTVNPSAHQHWLLRGTTSLAQARASMRHTAAGELAHAALLDDARRFLDKASELNPNDAASLVALADLELTELTALDQTSASGPPSAAADRRAAFVARAGENLRRAQVIGADGLNVKVMAMRLGALRIAGLQQTGDDATALITSLQPVATQLAAQADPSRDVRMALAEWARLTAAKS